MPKQLSKSKKPSKKPHGLNRAAYKRIKRDVAKIDRLISNPEALKQCEFPFSLATVMSIPALGQPKTNRLRYKFKIGTKEYRYICCLLQQIQEHYRLEHQ